MKGKVIAFVVVVLVVVGGLIYYPHYRGGVAGAHTIRK